MFRRKIKGKTLYEIAAKRDPILDQWVSLAGVVVFFVSLPVLRFLMESLQNLTGIDVIERFASGDGVYGIVLFVVFYFGIAFVPAYFAYWWLGRRLARAYSFLDKPACYNCGYAIPELLHEGGPLPLSESVVGCPECGAACPVVCLKDGKLVPVGTRSAQA